MKKMTGLRWCETHGSAIGPHHYYTPSCTSYPLFYEVPEHVHQIRFTIEHGGEGWMCEANCTTCTWRDQVLVRTLAEALKWCELATASR